MFFGTNPQLFVVLPVFLFFDDKYTGRPLTGEICVVECLAYAFCPFGSEIKLYSVVFG